MPQPQKPREIKQIARDIFDNWKARYADKPGSTPNFIRISWPYLEAMMKLKTASKDEKYGMEDAQMIVLYFLNNVIGWKGDDARKFKKELNDARIYWEENNA